MTISGKLPDGRGVSLSIAHGKIAALDTAPAARSTHIVAPGFIDLQVNGWGGVAFNDPRLTTEQVESVTQKLWQTGVALYCPTLITDSFDNLSRGMAAIARARRDSRVGRSIIGIHLEGPFISRADGPRGAHPIEHVRPPDWDEFRRLQEAADGLICLVTLAPEVDGAIAFIEKLVASGVSVAIGHTDARSEHIRDAIAAGACMATHLGNAAHDRLQRHRNYVYDLLAADELWASLIVDGHHLPPDLVKIFVRAKRPERTILVSDAMVWAGMPAGRYPFGTIEVEVREDGFIGVVGQPRLAGSGLLLARGIENVVRFAGVSLAQAVDMVTRHPAEAIGRSESIGSIAESRDATLTVFSWNAESLTIQVHCTIVQGDVVSGTPGDEID